MWIRVGRLGPLGLRLPNLVTFTLCQVCSHLNRIQTPRELDIKPFSDWMLRGCVGSDTDGSMELILSSYERLSNLSQSADTGVYAVRESMNVWLNVLTLLLPNLRLISICTTRLTDLVNMNVRQCFICPASCSSSLGYRSLVNVSVTRSSIDLKVRLALFPRYMRAGVSLLGGRMLFVSHNDLAPF